MTAKRQRRRTRTLEQRFWDFVHFEPNSGCWLWGGSAIPSGYGQIRIEQTGPGALLLATHVSLQIHGRPLPPGMHACHKCDNPPCVNPDHLFHGTRSDNMKDCFAKGRMPPRKLGILKKNPRLICKNGHEVDNDLYIRPDGMRGCRACIRDTKKRMRERRYAAGLTSRGKERILVR